MSFNDRYRLKCNKDEFVQNTVAGHEPMSLHESSALST